MNLNLLSAEVNDAFLACHRELEVAGRLNHPFTEAEFAGPPAGPRSSPLEPCDKRAGAGRRACLAGRIRAVRPFPRPPVSRRLKSPASPSGSGRETLPKRLRSHSEAFSKPFRSSIRAAAVAS
jgi:hypothetical protein